MKIRGKYFLVRLNFGKLYGQHDLYQLFPGFLTKGGVQSGGQHCNLFLQFLKSRLFFKYGLFFINLFFAIHSLRFIRK